MSKIQAKIDSFSYKTASTYEVSLLINEVVGLANQDRDHGEDPVLAVERILRNYGVSCRESAAPAVYGKLKACINTLRLSLTPALEELSALDDGIHGK